MKIVNTEIILGVGTFQTSEEWHRIHSDVLTAIRAVEWPAGAGKFSIYPESGKARGMGNGVTPIKLDLARKLTQSGWEFESKSHVPVYVRPGGLDALIRGSDGQLVAVEWETGNIASAHRAMNKLALGLVQGYFAAGMLAVPSRALAKYLPDRCSTLDEFRPYLAMYRELKIRNGILEVIEFEHDEESTDVPKIPKGTSGRALG